MKIIHVKNPESREACLAQLCANVYGQKAGLDPLVTFTGTLGVLFEQDAARIFVLADEQQTILAMLLLVSDIEGQGMEVTLLSTPETGGDEEHVKRLVREMSTRAPLRVQAPDEASEAFFRDCGITQWLDMPDGVRLGLGSRHEKVTPDALTKPLRFNAEGVVQTFKREPETFESYKARFIAGLERFDGRV
ncbi:MULTISPECIES: hypothetical protein [Chromohalobacter]|uniref:hypothetical protein n=1 Tax=Chromohalobacter TaxID=42054 RepID=UPI001FFC731E|nr:MULTISPECIES: hypothetical protein [Chromohalobacter]MCK2044919.1 hypothetical protein [Chromohalobacter moromii]MCT8467906.1 hypothetical protein [Chromohalobacter canadensis]MCT8470345.1 hypothetical protein [Chromohalobacter canadensis]MCT8498403.1 hypothetical protein [Chromohalobacter canadensis]